MSETRFTAAPTSRYETPSMVGTVLGNYRLISEISSGGMGTVYRAQHEILGRLAAVKLLRPDLDASQELIDRFFNEAKAASTIRHPGIVEVYDFGYSDAGNAYLVMELLEGKPLDQALAEVERFPEMEAGSIARGIASALKSAHSQGIVHRDLKPDNVFLVPDLEGTTGSMRPKVLDFGIAKLQAPDQAHHTQIGALIGTPLYMAPEQAREASSIDHRADLYSLGCILYEMLVGRPPFMADGAGELVAMHLFADPESPRVAVPGLSPEIEAIVLRLLAKEPDQRFQSAGDVANALSMVVGVRVSAELGIQRQTMSNPAASRSRLDAISTLSQVDLSAEMRPPTPEAPKRTLPIIAGVATAVIAIAVIVTLALRRGSDDPASMTEEPKRVEIEATPKPPVRETTPGRGQDGPPPPPPAPIVSPAQLDKPRKPTKPPVAPKPPVTRPGQVDEKPATTPRKGPTTSEGSPIETDLEPVKQKEASP